MTVKSLRQGAVGICISNKKDLFLSGSRLFQSALNWNFVEQLNEESDDFKSKGKIGDDYEGTEQHHACLQEILNFLEDDLPDKTRFSFLKKIFLVTSTGMLTDNSSVCPNNT